MVNYWEKYVTACNIGPKVAYIWMCKVLTQAN